MLYISYSIVDDQSAWTVASLQNGLTWWWNTTGQLGSGCPDAADPLTVHADDQNSASCRHLEKWQLEPQSRNGWS